jgi:hypothetical protein
MIFLTIAILPAMVVGLNMEMMAFKSGEVPRDWKGFARRLSQTSFTGFANADEVNSADDEFAESGLVGVRGSNTHYNVLRYHEELKHAKAVELLEELVSILLQRHLFLARLNHAIETLKGFATLVTRRKEQLAVLRDKETAEAKQCKAETITGLTEYTKLKK